MRGLGQDLSQRLMTPPDGSRTRVTNAVQEECLGG